MKSTSLVHGAATGEILYSDVALSFWAGVDPQTGEIIDRHHPLNGCNIHNRMLALPSSRGSCSGSLVMIELLLQGIAPAGLVFQEPEQIITLGVVVAGTLLGLSIPVLQISESDFDSLRCWRHASISGSEFLTSDSPLPLPQLPPPPPSETDIRLSETDKEILNGLHGPAPKKAMEILFHFARLQNAPELTSVSRAHIDACIYTGPASLLIAETFLSFGARVSVPTTLNSISIDQQRWRELGIPEELASQANRLANAYVSMGAQGSFTCAPYLLDSPPKSGESIGWAESNAVVFANSVLGARTQKYPDLIDVCIALTGRAPLVGAQTEAGRVPVVCVDVSLSVLMLETFEDAFYPLLGYAVGKVVGGGIPLVTGLENVPRPCVSDLKAFGAAFATTASAPMFHIAGVTGEAARFSAAGLQRIELDARDISSAYDELNTATDDSVGLMSLGNPHFSVEEFGRLAALCAGRRRAESVRVVITTNRQVYERASAEGYVSTVESFGAQILTDTCWCMLGEPVVDGSVRNLMTNSAKYAHYAPGMVRRGVRFGSLGECVAAAVTGRTVVSLSPGEM